MGKKTGKIASQPKSEQKPYTWSDYGDGSGHMVTDMGHIPFEYDLSTRELKNGILGRYVPMDMEDEEEGWREKCENTYMERIRPEEIKAKRMAEHGVWYPTYPCVATPQDGCSAVFIDNGVLLPMDKFNEVAKNMRLAERENYADHTSEDNHIASCIKRGLCEPDERGIGCRFDFEGKTFTILVDDFEQVPLHDNKLLEKHGMPLVEQQADSEGMEF